MRKRARQLSEHGDARKMGKLVALRREFEFRALAFGNVGCGAEDLGGDTAFVEQRTLDRLQP